MSLAIGFYTTAEQTIPVFDPGTDVDCPICTLPLNHPDVAIKTVSVMPADNRVVSCFYRVHRDCQEALSEAEKATFCATACAAALNTLEDSDG